MNDSSPELEMLHSGNLTILGAINTASNATLLCEVADAENQLFRCVYKPIRGEQPLWDFPEGTLAGREYASYLIAQALGWNIVPPTAFREIAPYGPGTVQLWVIENNDQPAVEIYADDELPPGYHQIFSGYDNEDNPVVLAHSDEPGLRRIALFDLLVNNADRKGGHILCSGTEIYGIDHGLTLHSEPKLRTVLWGWANIPLTANEISDLEQLSEELLIALASYITPVEIQAFQQRVKALIAYPVFPEPSSERPLPWPPI